MAKDGKRISRFFETELEQDEFLEAHSYLTEDCFNALFNLEQDTLSQMLYIESKRQDVPFKDIWDFGQKHIDKTKRICRVNIIIKFG